MPARILVVNDDLPLEQLIEQKFSQNILAKEYEFIFARDGREALEKLQENSQFDLVLTDINLPDIDGVSWLDKLKQIDRNIQAVAVLNSGDTVNIRKAMNQGAFDFVTKPIDIEDLEKIVKNSIESGKKIKENSNNLNQTKAQLLQNEKMASIGQVAAGVAHEINNPVGCIGGNITHVEGYIKDLLEHLELYQEKFPSPGDEIEEHAEEIDIEYLTEDLQKILGSIKGATERINQISNCLRIFARSDSTTKAAANLNECLDSTLLILKQRMKGKQGCPPIQIIKEYGKVPDVECYAGQINQVFLNIITNAIEALEEVTWNREVEKGAAKPPSPTIWIRSEVSEDKTGLVIRIKDNGPGMTSEVKDRAFEPLFTTKSLGKAAGLGLSLSKQIVEEKHGGKLTCVSEPGEGAEFAIAIPLVSS